jgi:hypothetical protein
MSQKWRFDPKWRIKIRFFDVTLRGLNKTQILWKKGFSKIQDGGSNDFFILAAILDFLKNFFSIKFASYQHQMNAKRRLKKCWIPSEL